MTDQFHSGRGGSRPGAGRPPGKRSPRTEQLRDRITPAEKAHLQRELQRLRGEKKEDGGWRDSSIPVEAARAQIPDENPDTKQIKQNYYKND